MKFNKFLVVLIAILMVVSLASCAADQNAPDGMKNAAREEDPYYLYVPESWMTNEGDIVSAYYSNTDKSNVSVIPYGGDFASTDEYWEDFKTRCTAEFAEFEVIAEKSAKVISQRNALQFTYKFKVDGVLYQCQQTVCEYGGLLYVITYTATAENYESHASEIDSILTEFKFK